MRRFIVSAVAFLVSAIVVFMMVACGHKGAPTPQDIQRGVKFFNVTRPDGTKMECLSYDSFQDDSEGDTHVVFAVDCDWSGTQHLG